MGEEAEGSETQPSATYFISLNIFIPVEIIVSQGYCESRDILFMTIVQTQCCQFYFLIKKRVDVTKGGLCSLPRWVGCSYLQLKKAIYNLKK